MSKDRNLDQFLGQLNRESEQERLVDANEGSYFADVPDDVTQVTRAREFDDIEKHWVRREVWLRTAKTIAKSRDSRTIRLLTLPGRHRLEVFLYLKHKLLEHVDIDGRTRPYVVGFETDPAVFGLLETSEPRLLEMLRGDILVALTGPTTPNGIILRKHAPYDVINLDLTANISSKNDGPYTPFLQGVRECFQVQGNQIRPWALMVTFRAGMMDTEPSVVEELQEFLQKNLDDHLKVREACFDRYKIKTAKTLLRNHPEEALGQLTAKWIVETGHQFEWECAHFRHIAYNRPYMKKGVEHSYSLRKLVFQFKKRLANNHRIPMPAIHPQSWHADDLANIFAPNTFIDVNSSVSQLAADKRSIVEREIAEFQRST